MNKIINIVVIELTSACNLKCRHCYSFFEENKSLSITTFSKIITEIKKMNCSMITLTGGEPFILNEKVLEYIQIARRNGIKHINLTTNGTIDFEKVSDIINEVDYIQVSLDGDKPIHDKIRGVGNFDKTMNFISKYSNDAKCFGVMFTAHDLNASKIDYVYNLTKEFGLVFGFEVATPGGRGQGLDVTELTHKNIRRFIKENAPIITNDPQYRIYQRKDSISEIELKYGRGGCSAGITSISFDNNGNIFPCARLRLSLGNINEDSLINILENSKIISDLEDRENFLGDCYLCKFLRLCGDCRATIYSKQGELKGGEQHCWLKHLKD